MSSSIISNHKFTITGAFKGKALHVTGDEDEIVGKWPSAPRERERERDSVS